MSARPKRRSRRGAKRPSRWLAVGVGLTAFAAASWLLLGGNRDLPVGEIDTASRARLEQVLERADREDAR